MSGLSQLATRNHSSVLLWDKGGNSSRSWQSSILRNHCRHSSTWTPSSKISSKRKSCQWEQDWLADKCQNSTKWHCHWPLKIRFTRNFWVTIRRFISNLNRDSRNTSSFTKTKNSFQSSRKKNKLKAKPLLQASRPSKCLNRHSAYNRQSLTQKYSLRPTRLANLSIQTALWIKLQTLFSASIPSTLIQQKNGPTLQETQYKF